MDKIENYIGYALGEEFKKDFPDCLKDKIIIVLKLEREPSEILSALCENIKEWVESYGLRFSMKY